MKRTILIPLLLSTFHLVGCSQEPTELERCIEANGGNVEFDEDKFKEKHYKFSTQYSRELLRQAKTKQDRDPERLEQILKEYMLSLDPIGTEVDACFEEKWMKESDKIKAELKKGTQIDLAKRILEIDDEAIINSCLPSTKAKKFSNAQGIY